MKISILGEIDNHGKEACALIETYNKVVCNYFKKSEVFTPTFVQSFKNNYAAKHKSASQKDVAQQVAKYETEQIETSDAIIADISCNSTELGLKLALCKNKNVCFFAQDQAEFSSIIEGMFPDAPIVRYIDNSDLERKLNGIIKKYLKYGKFIRHIKKAGCVFFDPKTKDVGLIYREKQQDYTFPKGHLEEGETLIDCAIRETAEETKRDVKLLSKKPIASLKYVDGSADDSYVEYYLAIDIGHSDNTSTDTHELVWTPCEEIEKTLTYDDLKVVWHAAYPKIKNYKQKR